MASLNLVLPGDEINLNNLNSSEITLGPNLRSSKENNSVLQPTTSGILIAKEKKKDELLYYVESNSKRYIPQIGDFIIGIIVGTFGDYYRVSLNNFSSTVLLNQYSFPNASKKNKPHLKINDLVFARVNSTETSVEVELSCVDPITGKDGGFGLLSDGYCFNITLAYARFLLFNPNALILNKLVSKCKFEIAIGVNGKIWIKTDNTKLTLACVNAIKNSENCKSDEVSKLVDEIFKKFK